MKTIYFSEVLNKNFETVEALEKAEKEYQKKVDSKAKERAEREADAKVVELKAKAYLAEVEQNNKIKADLKAKEAELYSEYQESINTFAEKHGGYRLEYKKEGDNIEFKVQEVQKNTNDLMLADFRDLMTNIFDILF